MFFSTKARKAPEPVPQPMTEPVNEPCRLCGKTATRGTSFDTDLVHITGCWCSEFWLDRCDWEDFLNNTRWVQKAPRRELSALLRERIIQRARPVFLRIGTNTRETQPGNAVAVSYDELIAAWPHSVADRLDRVLLNIAALSPTGGTIVNVSRDNQRDLALLFARNDNEGDYHVKALIDLKYVAPPSPSDSLRASITPAGWARVSEIQSSRGSRDNPPFVAMWFGDKKNKTKMDAVYRVICEACKATGWRMPIRADSEQHNDFIMDRILGDIRGSPFVIADFTRNRNGVYIEAGFARGLGKPVVHTCRADYFKRAHFDIKQINAIKWTSLDDLREGVTQRIRGSEIGEATKLSPNPSA